MNLKGLLVIRQRPTLPHSCPCSTIGAIQLNFRVRDGNGCDLVAITTEKLYILYCFSDVALFYRLRFSLLYLSRQALK